jgi:GTPase SAR1 family protein
LGPRASGKTSFLYKAYFKYNIDQPHTEFDVIPTPNHNVEVVPFGSYSFELWDFAGKKD